MAGCSSWNRMFLSLPLRLRKLNLRAGRQREGGEMLFSDTAQPCSHALRATVAVYSRSLQGHSLPWWTLLTHSRGGALLSCIFTEELRGSWGTVNTHGHTDDPGSNSVALKEQNNNKIMNVGREGPMTRMHVIHIWNYQRSLQFLLKHRLMKRAEKKHKQVTGILSNQPYRGTYRRPRALYPEHCFSVTRTQLRGLEWARPA